MTRSPWVFRAVRLVVLASAAMLAVLALTLGSLEQPSAAGETGPVRGAPPAGVATLGDLVWYDTNRSGQPDPGEIGIDNVLVELYRDDGDAVFEPGTQDLSLGQLATGDNPGLAGVDHGWYDFNIPATDALYWVVIVASNFEPGRPLAGHALTSGAIIGDSPLLVYVALGQLDYNDADFGYVSDQTPTPTPTLQPSTATPTVTTSATGTRTPTTTATASATATASPTATLSAQTPTATPTASASLTASPTKTASATETRSPTPTASATASASPTRTPTSTATRTPTGTASPTGTPTSTPGTRPTCGPDTYEPDNTQDQAKPIIMGEPGQSHVFYGSSDVDWFRFDNLTIGWSYVVSTSDLLPGTDTYIELYDNAGVRIRFNDDKDVALCVDSLLSFCASSVSWTATYPGPYFLLVRTLTYNPGTCPGYDIRARALRYWVPQQEQPGPLPTVTPTPTVSKTPTVSPTPAATYTPTATPRPTGTRTATVTPKPTKTPVPTATIVLPPGIDVPGLQHPKGLAVNPETHLVYITSGANNRLLVLDGQTYETIDNVPVGDQPWGVALNPTTNKLYVANFASGDVYVLDAATRALLAVIPVGPKPTFVQVNPLTNRVFVVTYANQSLVVIDGDRDVVERITPNVGVGAWGLAINPNLNRVYVASRDSGMVVTLDGNDSYRILTSQTIKPCGGAGAAPFAMDFNPLNDKLYIACAPFHNVNSAAVYRASSFGLWQIAFLSIGDGGDGGGGGVAVNTTTGNAFFTNSLSHSVSVVSGTSDLVIGTEPVGLDPFGVAVDPIMGQVFVGNRGTDNLNVFFDTYR
jgi:YVTN family beta-propeller protein